MSRKISKTRKFIAFLFAMLLTTSIFIVPLSFNAKAASPETISWDFDSETGKLTISGNGKMENLYNDETFGGSIIGDIEEIYIEEGITSIYRFAFGSMEKLKKITIPSSVTIIEEYAFQGCNALEEITIPDGVIELSNYAFSGCKNLKKVNIGKDLSKIGYFFLNCPSIESFSVSPENPVFSSEDGVLFNKDKTKLIQYPVGNTRDTYNVPDGVEIIGDESFVNAEALQNITLPDSVTEIGTMPFANTGFFNNEDNWTDEALYIGDKHLIFVGRTEFISGDYEVKDGTEVIAGSAFRNCDLTSITIPASVKSVGKTALSCPNLSEIIVDEENKYLTSVDNVLFSKDMSEIIYYPMAKSGTSYEIPAGVTKIVTHSFEGTALSEIVIPEGVTEIGDYAFAVSDSLSKVTFPDSLVSVGYAAFYYCNALESADFGSKLQSIGDYAFYGCYNLSSVELSEGLNEIGAWSFYQCYSLEEISVPYSVKKIDDMAFALCDSLKSVTVGINPEAENDLFSVKSSDISIDYWAFGGCTQLTSAVLNVKHINLAAFTQCPNIENLTLFDSLVSIEYGAFADCGIKDIYYYGATEEWEKVAISNYNEALFEAEFHAMRKSNETNGVIATYPVDCFDEEVTLSVENVENPDKPVAGDFYEMDGMKRIGLYSIKAINSNSEPVQPANGKVTIKLPVPDSYYNYENFTVCHFFEGGREIFKAKPVLPTDKELKLIDGYLVFEIEHFSEFAIYIELNEPTPDPEPTEKTVSSVAISAPPAKTTYTYKMDSLDLSGLALTVSYSDGTTETVTNISEMNITGFDNSKTGKQTVTVELDGATAKFDVTVSYAWWQWIIRILLLGFLWY